MNYKTPEAVGIKSSHIKEYIELLENAHLSTHDLIIMRGDSIVFENYWKPFHKDFLHRMYSVTKSFVTIAIGFLLKDGLVSLDDPISKYFPKEAELQESEYMRNQTVKHMLMMSTSKTVEDWFNARHEDRVRFYFENENKMARPSGTTFEYDSTGTFVLGALVERQTGKELITYLREKLFDKIGVSKEAYFLKCPGGHSWSDSALLCTPLDLLKVAKFLMNKGRHNGEQLLDEEFITEATSKQIETCFDGVHDHSGEGYGYYIWRTFDNSYFMNGMGGQFAICVPDKDIIMIHNADNQGNSHAPLTVIESFFRLIVRRASDSALPENEREQRELRDYASTLELYAVKGEKTSPCAEKINGKEFIMHENPMGIKSLRITFEDERGVLAYTNKTGYKEIPFGLSKNELSYFPEMGYSDTVGSERGERLYKCASSGAWLNPNQLFIKVQIIDTYFGNLHITVGLNGNNIGVYMTKAAEDFLNEYSGFCGGYLNE